MRTFGEHKSGDVVKMPNEAAGIHVDDDKLVLLITLSRFPSGSSVWSRISSTSPQHSRRVFLPRVNIQGRENCHQCFFIQLRRCEETFEAA